MVNALEKKVCIKGHSLELWPSCSTKGHRCAWRDIEAQAGLLPQWDACCSVSLASPVCLRETSKTKAPEREHHCWLPRLLNDILRWMRSHSLALLNLGMWLGATFIDFWLPQQPHSLGFRHGHSDFWGKKGLFDCSSTASGQLRVWGAPSQVNRWLPGPTCRWEILS